MHKSQIHQYKLRVSTKLKELLAGISEHRHRSVKSQVIETIKAPSELVTPPYSSISINFPVEIFQSLKSAAALKKMSVNDEILDRIYWSNPQAELDYLNGRDTSSDYPLSGTSQKLMVKEEPNPQGLCTQTEDERIMLEEYRAMSADQRTQMQAISDAIYEPKKLI